MGIHCFERDELIATPWKNGGGMTQEIACSPAPADLHSFDWRLSIAHISSDGGFSAFPGVDRVITLLEGAGVHLSSPAGGIDHALSTPLTPFAFAGEAAVQARLLGPHCHDLNVMTRRGVWQAQVSIIREARLILPASAGMLLAMHGRWQVHGVADVGLPAPTYTVHARSGLWWKNQSLAWQCHDIEPDAALLAVCFTRALAAEDAPLT
jgi:environmental stress-induced protein Ves